MPNIDQSGGVGGGGGRAVWKEVIGKAVERPVDGTGREGGGPVGRRPS